jgi:hypothetical protein
MKALTVLLMIITSSALAEDFPLRDPTNDCREATRLFGSAVFNSCINQAQFYYDVAKVD